MGDMFMYLQKIKKDDQLHLEVRTTLREKWLGLALLSIFLLPVASFFLMAGIIYRALVPGVIGLISLLLYISLTGFHAWHRRHVLCIIDDKSQVIRIKRLFRETTVGFDEVQRVILKRRYHLWYEFETPKITMINLEQRLRDEFGHLYDIKLQVAPPPYILSRTSKRKNEDMTIQVNLADRNVGLTIARWLDVSDKPEIVEKYRFSSRTKIGPYDSAMMRPVVVNKAKAREIQVDLQTSSNPNYPVNVLTLRNNDVTAITALRQLAEELAETLAVPLLDESGFTPKLKKPGTTDVFLGALIKEQQGDQFNLETISAEPTKVQVHVENDRITKLTSNLNELQGMSLTALKLIGFGLLILLGLYFIRSSLLASWHFLLISLSDFSLSVDFILYRFLQFIYFMTMLLAGVLAVIFGARKINDIKRVISIEFGKEEVTIKQQGLFYSRLLATIPLQKIEDVAVIQEWEWPKVEIISDETRVILDGYYSFATATKLKEALGLALATWA